MPNNEIKYAKTPETSKSSEQFKPDQISSSANNATVSSVLSPSSSEVTSLKSEEKSSTESVVKITKEENSSKTEVSSAS